VVRAGSPLKTVADLKEKRIALNKGSNVHYLLVRALERARLKYSEIEPIYLAPADARAAFERSAVDAWVIWDPFRAAVEAAVRFGCSSRQQAGADRLDCAGTRAQLRSAHYAASSLK
jgi:sulfonate transport system substrate-binding protein